MTTRRTYLLLAQALKDAGEDAAYADMHAQHDADCRAVADALLRENPRGFDRGMFLENCGVDPRAAPFT